MRRPSPCTGRRFVLSYFMMDDSLLIFEPPIRNSGIVGGKFLERQRVYKPESEEIYTYQVGLSSSHSHVKLPCWPLQRTNCKLMQSQQHAYSLSAACWVPAGVRTQQPACLLPACALTVACACVCRICMLAAS